MDKYEQLLNLLIEFYSDIDAGCTDDAWWYLSELEDIFAKIGEKIDG